LVKKLIGKNMGTSKHALENTDAFDFVGRANPGYHPEMPQDTLKKAMEQSSGRKGERTEYVDGVRQPVEEPEDN
jgi:hypothetical protein